jgi:hypothetical protein
MQFVSFYQLLLRGGHEDIVIKLLEHQAEVNKADNDGRTALIAAAYMGHAEIVQDLLNYNADVNHQDKDGRTALSVAALCIRTSEQYLHAHPKQPLARLSFYHCLHNQPLLLLLITKIQQNCDHPMQPSVKHSNHHHQCGQH